GHLGGADSCFKRARLAGLSPPCTSSARRGIGEAPPESLLSVTRRDKCATIKCVEFADHVRAKGRSEKQTSSEAPQVLKNVGLPTTCRLRNQIGKRYNFIPFWNTLRPGFCP